MHEASCFNQWELVQLDLISVLRYVLMGLELTNRERLYIYTLQNVASSFTISTNVCLCQLANQHTESNPISIELKLVDLYGL